MVNPERKMKGWRELWPTISWKQRKGRSSAFILKDTQNTAHLMTLGRNSSVEAPWTLARLDHSDCPLDNSIKAGLVV